MGVSSLYHTFQRYRTLRTDVITALPIVILMPHSACNCKCVMCDIWKGNQHLRQLTEQDVAGLLETMRTLNTRQVLLSGGEALLNPNFFQLCDLLRREDISVSLLSTGLSMARHADRLMSTVGEIIVSLDGPEDLHDAIRNIPGAFRKLKEGVRLLHGKDPDYRITARTVIHRLNFRSWPAILEAALSIGVKQISFLPADVSSQAFNRAEPWDEARQHEILPATDELPELLEMIERIIQDHDALFKTRFIAESPAKLRKIGEYYMAAYGLNPYPFKKCNAPWVSTVVEADGTVRPCFFLPALGNIHDDSLEHILNSKRAIQFRKTLDTDTNETCMKCVCYLNLQPRAKLNGR
jgi:MoaA/NifB/PqqE/SkfB family radical SAM enzyme